MTLDQFNELIEAIYSAGVDPQKWDRVLRLMTAYLAGAGAALHVGNLDNSGFAFGATFNIDPECLLAYEQHYYSVNPLNTALALVPRGVAVPDHALVSRSEMRRSEFCSDFYRRFDLEGSATLVLDKAKGATACLGVVRSFNSEEFTEEQLRPLELLRPHLLRAIEFNKQLVLAETEKNAALSALDNLDAAVFLLKEGGVLAYCNPAGDALLRARDVLILSEKKIRAVHPEAARKLGRLIFDAVNGIGSHGGSLALPQPSGKRPLSARVLRVVGQESFVHVPQVKAVVFVSSPDEKSRSGVEHLAQMYTLTEAETRLVAALVEGSNLQEASDAQQITKGTARKHLAHIMAKTGTNRQAELIALVLTGRLPLR
jgi:DNA-binding CsgD family transcriptional regulator